MVASMWGLSARSMSCISSMGTSGSSGPITSRQYAVSMAAAAARPAASSGPSWWIAMDTADDTAMLVAVRLVDSVIDEIDEAFGVQLGREPARLPGGEESAAFRCGDLVVRVGPTWRGD